MSAKAAAPPLVPGASISSANLRDTNPNLYWSLMASALGFTAEGVNFLRTTPAFEQYGIPKNLIGAVFLTVGVCFLVFLNLRRNLKAVRRLLIVSIVCLAGWAWGTAETSFAGESSFQLPITYLVWAALLYWLLRTPFFDPVAANGKVE